MKKGSILPYCRSCREPKETRTCLPCRRSTQRRSYHNRQESIKAYRATDRHKELHALSMWHSRHKSFTMGDYFGALDRQGGGCAICGTTDSGAKGNGRFHIDHDHTCCGKGRSCPSCRRGLLCSACNVMLGMSGDSAQRLRAGAKYLVVFQKGTKC